MYQYILIGSTLVGSWLGMQVVHELGHVLGAWATGGKVSRVVLSPTTLTRTDVTNNSRPLIVAWAGPVVGIALPLLLWFGMQAIRRPSAIVLRFFAGFCLIVNGLYIGLGSFGRVGDCGEMLRHGSAPWQLWLFGAVTAPIGLALWHGQGSSFGFGSAHGQVSHAAAHVSLATCLALLPLAVIVGGN